MKPIFLFALVCLSGELFAQYKNDDVKFKTVFLDDFCKTLEVNKNFVLLDVRTKGEFADTSSSPSMNLGHIKGAIHIPIDELSGRIGEIRKYSKQPVVVYCSHSQRSRRASSMLADSGFVNVMNLNGGLTFFNQLAEAKIPCTTAYLESANPYKFITAPALLEQLKSGENIQVVDLREDSVFRGISLNEAMNANGRIRGAVNIPYSTFTARVKEVPAGKTIVLVDDAGSESPKAAKTLLDQGHKNVLVTFNGMNMWNATPLAEMKMKNDYWTSPYNFTLITADDFNDLARQQGSLIVDLRTGEEFNNKSKEGWRNRGNIKGARSIPAAALLEHSAALKEFKDKPIFLYHLTNQPEMYRVARQLADDGFSKVYVLVGGIWNMAWRAANIKDKKNLNSWLENIPPENM